MKNKNKASEISIEAFAGRHRLHVVRDPEDPTAIVPGRKGKSHLFEYGEGLLIVIVIPDARMAHRWHAARGAFVQSGMEIRQDGDQEGVATFDPENPGQVRPALKYAEVKRKRKVSEQLRQRLIEMGFKKPPAAVPRAS